MVRVDSELDVTNPSGKQTLKLTIFNRLDSPAEINLQLTDSEYIDYEDSLLQQGIPPNSVEMLEIDLLIKSPADSAAFKRLQDEISQQRANWSLTYDFEKYGQIEVSGNTGLY